MVSAAFECGDAAGVGSELLGGLGDGDVGVLTSAAEPGAVRGWWRVGQESVDLSGDVPLEAADDLFSVLSFPLAPCHVFFGGCVVAYPGGSDPPERVVGLAVTSPVETVPDGLSR